MRCRTSSRRQNSRNCLPRQTARASSARYWRADPRRYPPALRFFVPAPSRMSSTFRRTSRRRLPASLPIRAALRPRFPDVTTVCRLLGGTAHSRSRKECHRVSISRMDRGVRPRWTTAVCSARGDRRRSRRNPRADPATEGIVRSAHTGARGAPEGGRNQGSQRARRPSPLRRLNPRCATAPPAAPPARPHRATASASAFNPAISAVLQGVYANLSQDPNNYAITGFVPSGDIAPAKRGFSIAESELGLSANVDDKIYGNLIFSLAPDNTVEVEEAYGMFTALPYGLTPKFGRFLSSIGYLNDQHQHVWDFYDAPLPYQAFLGGQFRSDGLQLKWVAPTDDVPRVRRGNRRRRELPRHRPQQQRHRQRRASTRTPAATSAPSNSWRAGCRIWAPSARSCSTRRPIVVGNPAQLSFSRQEPARDRRLRLEMGAQRQRARHQLQAAGRVLLAQGIAAISPTTATARCGLTSTSNYSSRQSGWYLDGVYQFMPYWRVGARYDRLVPGSVDYGANGAYLAQESFTSAALLGDVRLHAVGVQPLPPAVAAEQDPAATSPTTSSSSNTS